MKKAKQVILILTFCFLQVTAAVKDKAAFISYLDSKEKEYENLMIEKGTDVYDYYTTNDPSSKEIELKISNLLLDPMLNEEIQHWFQNINEFEDIRIQSRLIIWNRMLEYAKVNYNKEILALANKIENELNLVDIGDTTITAESINTQMYRLVELRNRKARELGYNHYADFMLVMRGFSKEWFDEFCDTIFRETQTKYEKLVDEVKNETRNDVFSNKDALGLFFNYGPNADYESNPKIPNEAALKSTMHDLGFDFDALPIKWEEKELPPQIGGQGIAISIPGDFRAVLNLEMPLSVWFHELGHGMQWMHVRESSPILKGYEWIGAASSSAYAESMADTWARITRNKIWLQKYSDFTPEQVAERDSLCRKYFPAYIRFYLVNVLQEYELYSNAHPDMLNSYNNLMKKFMSVTQPADRTRPAANLLYLTYPMYFYNYIISDAVAWQIHTSLEKKYGTDYLNSPETGKYLIENAYSEGELNSLDLRMEKLTGKKLDMTNYIRSNM